jgi:uncharacterized protein YjbJ (UPF0337 family)
MVGPSLPAVQATKGIDMSEGTKDEVKGKFHEVKGTIKEELGRATNDPELGDEGTAEKVGGKIQKMVGQVEKVIEKP